MIINLKAFLSAVYICTLSIIYRPLHLTDVWESYIIKRHIRIRPFHLLKTENTLEVYDVRISSIKSCRLVYTMKVKHQMICSCGFSQTINHINTPLVITVEEVYLETFYSHLRVESTRFLKFIVQYICYSPNNDTNISFSTISNKTFQINGLFDNHNIILRRPSFINYDIWDVKSGCKIDICFIGFSIYTWFEIYISQATVIPPLPGNQSRLNPAHVPNFSRLTQKINQVVSRQLNIILCHSNNTPWIRTSTLRSSDYILTSGNLKLTSGRSNICAIRQLSKSC